MDPTPSPQHETLPLLEAARDRYLHYALSVITSRALPDVRDGLKPVQRRILYGMFHNLHLGPGSRYRKSATVVGEVMGKYHPHGDSALYEAMVRMAQDFALLHPLVDGQGNFGSIDGDNAAAMRYTEVRLRPIAADLLSELGAGTVDFRPSFDGQHFEPVVLPAQFPQLLVNGSEGIAVGMATRIPPHNLVEVIDAALLLIERPEATVHELCRKLKGPDFPTGGELVSSAAEIESVYTEGQGPLRLRATWTTEQRARKTLLVITSIPYGLVKGPLVEKLGEIVVSRKLPQITDIRDESTDEVRIVMELRAPGDAEAAMAWLYKHTALALQINVNLTCLVPTEHPEIGAPARLDLRSLLRHWLHFRFNTVERRIRHEMKQLDDRVHILEGFRKIFDILDEIIRLIRMSDGKRDAAERLMNRFDLDDLQVEAILEMKLWRLAKLEIQLILDELAQKAAEASRLSDILASNDELWKVVQGELRDVRKQHGRRRRTTLRSDAAELAYREDDYVVSEDTWVVVTREGWIKRQSSVTALDKVRLREGDSIGWVFRCSTTSNLIFLSSCGTAYVTRAEAVPATSGFGEPVQRSFTFADGERVVGVVSLDPRSVPEPVPPGEGEDPGPWLVAVTAAGRVVRAPLATHAEQSTKSGRKFMKVDAANDTVVAAYVSAGDEHVCVATRERRGLAFPVAEVSPMKGAAKGVAAIDIDESDQVIAFGLAFAPEEGVNVSTTLGVESLVSPATCPGNRANRGKRLAGKGALGPWVRPIERGGRGVRGDEAGS